MSGSGNPRRRVAAAISILALVGCSDVSDAPVDELPVTIAIDRDSRHQTLLGLGAFGGQRPPWGRGAVSSPAFVARVVNDLGLSLLRVEVPGSLEPTNDDDDPDSTNLPGFNLHAPVPDAHDSLGTHLEYLRAMRAAGVETFIGSVWSPPRWMKHNLANGNGTRHNTAPAYTREPGPGSNQLRREHFVEFAEFCVAYIRLLERETGIVLAALSLQNEPRFSQWYVSAVYDGEALRALVRVVGERFEREGIPTRIFLPEDTGSLDAIQALAQPTLQDPKARTHVGALAVHGYAVDGTTPAPGDLAPWLALAAWAEDNQLPLWMTEASGFERSWRGAMRLATSIQSALRFGNASAWAYYKLGETALAQDALIHREEAEPSPLYHAARHFYRYLRPGAVRVGSLSSDPGLRVVAFDGSDGKLVLVLVNNGPAARTARFSGADLPDHFERYESTDGARGLRLGDLEIGKGARLPARSLTTLVATQRLGGRLHPDDEEAPRANLARRHGLERRGGTPGR